MVLDYTGPFFRSVGLHENTGDYKDYLEFFLKN